MFATAAVSQLLSNLDIHIPIFAGADSPLIPTFTHGTWCAHGTDGLGDSNLPLPSVLPQEHAGMAYSSPGKYHVICLGTLKHFIML